MIIGDFSKDLIIYVVAWLACLFLSIKFILLSKNSKRSNLYTRMKLSGYCICAATALFLAFSYNLQIEAIGNIEVEMNDQESAGLLEANKSVILAINSYFELFKQIVGVFGAGVGGGILASGLVMEAQSGEAKKAQQVESTAPESNFNDAHCRDTTLNCFTKVSESVDDAFRKKT